MKKPNFFIIGAPKSGTTALGNYLDDLDSVFVTKPKEPHFFADDFPGYRMVGDMEEYLSLFESAGDSTCLGEGSVFYMYSDFALQNIRDFAPDAKLIVMLRNPIDLAHSLHAQMLYSHDEDIPDFAKAWELMRSRSRGENLPRQCREPKLLQYGQVAMLGKQMSRVYELFPRDNVLVILFQDFVSNTRREFRRTTQFLGVDDQGKTDFPKINESRRHRFPGLAKFVFGRTHVLRRPVQVVKSLFGIRKIGFLPLMRKIETKQERRKDISRILRAEMRSYFEPDIALLESRLGRKLDDWH